MQVIGPTYSGKTYFIIRLIDYCKTVFDKLPQHVYWFYGGKTKIHDKLASRKYKMHEGLPKNGFDFVKENSIIVLDDLMTDSKNDANVTKLFTQLAHHKKLFIINVKQNLYHQSREARDRTLNTQYLILFKNDNDPSQITRLGTQMYPGNVEFLTRAYNEAVHSKPHGYLLIDLHVNSDNVIKLRSNVLPDESPMVTFIDKQVAAKVHEIENEDAKFFYYK